MENLQEEKMTTITFEITAKEKAAFVQAARESEDGSKKLIPWILAACRDKLNG